MIRLYCKFLIVNYVDNHGRKKALNNKGVVKSACHAACFQGYSVKEGHALTLSPLSPGMPPAPRSPGIPCIPGGPWPPGAPAAPASPWRQRDKRPEW